MEMGQFWLNVEYKEWREKYVLRYAGSLHIQKAEK